VETQLPRRAFTVGVSAAAGTVTDTTVPATPLASVEPAPSVTSYVNPARGEATGVQDTWHVVADVRDVAALTGT